MANSAFTPAVLTVSGSSSTSSGEKNYVTATDGNASGLWVASGVTIATSTSTIPDNITKASSLAITWTSGTTGYARYRFTLDQADYGKKFKIQWDQVYGTAGHWTLQVYSNTASDYTGTSTALTVQTSAVPGITGTFTTSVDMSGSTAPYIEIRIVASSTSATTIYLNSILMGPGTITQGAAISEWVSYTPTLGNATASQISGFYRRVGSNMELRGNWRMSATGSAAVMTFSFPAGFTLNTAALAYATPDERNQVGSGFIYVSSSDIRPTNVVAYASTTLQFSFPTRFPILGSDLGTSNEVTFWASIPVNEFAGSGTVNLGAGAQVEYAANSSSTVTAGSVISESTTIYGPNGTSILSYNSTTTTSESKTIVKVQFQYPVQNDDAVILEINDGNNWLPVASRLPGITLNNSSYGMGIIAYSSTVFGVYFGNAGYSPVTAATWGAAGGAWSGLSSWKWRLRKAKASSPVGFGKADSTSFGLVAPRRGPLVVTSANQATYFSSLPSGFSMTRGVFIYYQDQDLNHRLKFNLVGSMTSATSASFTWASTAVVYKSGLEQAVTAWSGTSGSWSTGRVTGSVMNYYVASASTYVSLSGDVELESKPTWA